MANPQPYGGGWKPTSDQELLLRAALWQNDQAVAAWEQWYSATRLADIEQGSYRLLPLVYLNLQALGVKHPAFFKLDVIYRHARVRNQLKLRRAAQALKVLQAAGIPTLVMKACALIPLYYRDPGARPMGDIDILVPTAHAWHALELLVQSDWQPKLGSLQELKPQYFLRMHAQTLHARDGVELDLHRHLLWFETRDDGDAEFWAGAVPANLESVETSALNPADQLLHICTHGAEWNATSPIRWVADAYVLLRETEIDWQRFLRQAPQYECVVIARHSLRYLRDTMAVNIPAAVLAALDKIPVSRQERIRYDFLVNPSSEHNIALKLWYHYGQFRRLNQIYQDERWFLRFPAFLRDTWELPNLRAVPKYMVQFIVKRLGRRTYSQSQKLQGES